MKGLNTREEKGITLVTLTIMIIVLLILATIGINYSNSSQQSAKLTKYKTEIEILQAKIDTIKDDEAYNQEYENYGLTSATLIEKCNEILESELTNNFENIEVETYKKQFKYYTKEQIKTEIGITGMQNDYLINIKENIIISVRPLLYKNKKYYSIQGLENDGLANTLYRPTYEEDAADETT